PEKKNKALLLPWMQAQRAKGISYYFIAEALNQADIPSIRQKGYWTRTAVKKMLNLAKKAEATDD
ncbi:MAG: recombinase family protein, partial [Deltaproteobacteria bacterium]|nr:recombinase family protein [Deltaproteobacteria bacterium]